MTDTRTDSQPRVRIRMNHDWTREGWRLKETTVELEITSTASASFQAREELALWSQLVHDEGTREANRRNQEGN